MGLQVRLGDGSEDIYEDHGDVSYAHHVDGEGALVIRRHFKAEMTPLDNPTLQPTGPAETKAVSQEVAYYRPNGWLRVRRDLQAG